jgi:glycosyltransferase involved in cell wall biosynthesis
MDVRVLTIQRIVPPYRLRFFEAMARSGNIDLALAYGQPSAQSALHSVDPPVDAAYYPLNNRFFGSNEGAVWSTGLLRLISKRRFDVAIAEFNPRILSNVVACLLARVTGIPFIWWGHGLSPGSRDDDWITRLRIWLIRLSNAVILYEDGMAQRLAALGVASSKIFVARNTIDIEAIELVRAPSFPAGRFRILYTGRLVAGKKLLLLVDSFARIRSEIDSKIRLTILGDGPEDSRIKERISELGIGDRVDVIPGTYDEGELSRYFNSALISVTPGYVGLSVIHSLSYGVPVITATGESHSPEFAALSNGFNAELIPSDSAEDLAKTMARLLKDRDTLETYHRNALRTASEWDGVENMVSSFQQAIGYAMTDREQ